MFTKTTGLFVAAIFLWVVIVKKALDLDLHENNRVIGRLNLVRSR